MTGYVLMGFLINSADTFNLKNSSAPRNRCPKPVQTPFPVVPCYNQTLNAPAVKYHIRHLMDCLTSSTEM